MNVVAAPPIPQGLDLPPNARKMRAGSIVRGYRFDRYKTGRYEFAYHSAELGALIKSNPHKSTYSAWLNGECVGTRFQSATRAAVACIEKSAGK